LADFVLCYVQALRKSAEEEAASLKRQAAEVARKAEAHAQELKVRLHGQLGCLPVPWVYRAALRVPKMHAMKG
jgi:hypothetical protein